MIDSLNTSVHKYPAAIYYALKPKYPYIFLNNPHHASTWQNVQESTYDV
jgi:hypothetical protein